jgi:transmembrane sensor
MTGPEAAEDPEVLRAEAASWFVRVQSDAASEQDWLGLEAWLSGSAARRAAYDAVERLWSELDEVPSLEAAAQPARAAEVIDFASRRRERQKPARRLWPGWALAVSAAILVLGVWVLRPMEPPAQSFSTALGETRQIALADGSRIRLNSASRLMARVDRRVRRVTLQDGEAIFDVAKDSAHPFIVTVGDRQVTVVGTEFDILRHGGQIAVTVSRGVVEVQPATGGPGAAPVRLTPGEQLKSREGAPDGAVIRIPVDEVFSWRDGYLVYRTRTLAEVADDLNRYFPTPIRVEGPAARLTFSGALMIDDEDAVIGRLQSFLPIKAVRTRDKVTLSSR